MAINNELIAKAKETKSVEELMALAKENDIEMTEENAEAYFNQFHPTSGELSDEELDNVAGGSCYAGDGRMVTSLGHVCHEFSCKKDGSYAYGFICIVPHCAECGAVANCGSCRHCSYEKGLWLCNCPENKK